MILLRLFEGALTADDFFECAHDSTSSYQPLSTLAASHIALVLAYVILTSVLLHNMLVAMCAAHSHKSTPC